MSAAARRSVWCARWPLPASGALAFYAHAHGKLAEIAKERSLIIDPGARTFDWLVAQGMRLVQKQSHSVNPGCRRRAEAARRRDHQGHRHALPRSGRHRHGAADRQGPGDLPKPYDLKRLLPLAESVTEQAVSSMKEWIESPHSLQNIILVGGGAFLFRKAVKVGVSAPPDPRDQGACVRQREGVPVGRDDLCANRAGGRSRQVDRGRARCRRCA